MRSYFKEIVLDRLSIFGDGVTELAGRVLWSRPSRTDDARVWLRLTIRGTDDHQDIAGRLGAVSESESEFSVAFNLRSEVGFEYADVVDAYFVLRGPDGESIVRLAWPQATTLWAAYPTIYGNLSIKINNAGEFD